MRTFNPWGKTVMSKNDAKWCVVVWASVALLAMGSSCSDEGESTKLETVLSSLMSGTVTSIEEAVEDLPEWVEGYDSYMGEFVTELPTQTRIEPTRTPPAGGGPNAKPPRGGPSGRAPKGDIASGKPTDLADLKVYAVDTSGGVLESAVAEDGTFSIELEGGSSYMVGFVNTAQDEYIGTLVYGGNEGLTTSLPTTEAAFDLGTVTYYGGNFFPKNNPLALADSDGDGTADNVDPDNKVQGVMGLDGRYEMVRDDGVVHTFDLLSDTANKYTAYIDQGDGDCLAKMGGIMESFGEGFIFHGKWTSPPNKPGPGCQILQVLDVVVFGQGDGFSGRMSFSTLKTAYCDIQVSPGVVDMGFTATRKGDPTCNETCGTECDKSSQCDPKCFWCDPDCCACDRSEVCDANLPDAKGTCLCDKDCVATGELPCSADDACDFWCPAGLDPDCDGPQGGDGPPGDGPPGGGDGPPGE